MPRILIEKIIEKNGGFRIEIDIYGQNSFLQLYISMMMIQFYENTFSTDKYVQWYQIVENY